MMLALRWMQWLQACLELEVPHVQAEGATARLGGRCADALFNRCRDQQYKFASASVLRVFTFASRAISARQQSATPAARKDTPLTT